MGGFSLLKDKLGIDYILLEITLFSSKHSLFTASSGTVTINADSTVQILAEEAHPLDRFDPQVCH